MSTQDIMIQTEHMSHTYQDESGNVVYALDDVSLAIRKGEFVSIIGTNGSGKSTLAKHFNVLLTPSKGAVTVLGMDTKDPKKFVGYSSACGHGFPKSGQSDCSRRS